jgi:2-succinyl-5-enolpyruvyl-6-hydroxy-3-cyclohexene-1-carboxylate synthase
MTSDKKNVSLLAELFVKKGLSDIIISPGSRNAPIVIAFAGKHGVNALSIVDERSAGFFALGMAQQSGKAVAVACTSGSAALNYAPAIAEAYYQKIPLLVLTADRPPELIERGYGQIIRQKEVYKNYIKASFELPVDIEDEETFKNTERMINEAINLTQFPEPGPVHINIPFREPLYGLTDELLQAEVIDYEKEPVNTEQYISELADVFRKYDNILIIAGQQQKDEEFNTLLSTIVAKNVVVLSETTSNMHDDRFIDCIDNVISTIEANEASNFQPEVLLTFGGQVVSKMVKKFLRDHPPKEHWHISPSGEPMDTYFRLKRTVAANPKQVFSELLKILPESSSTFYNTWQQRKELLVQRKNKYLGAIPYSDLQVFDFLLKHLPDRTNLHLGNSTPVRYSQLFGSQKKFTYFSNRGVSGIDGQVSTAAGNAYANTDLHVVITGDLGFLYDSNALMNHYLKPNLKIIVINNAGGGIFRFIDGPAESGHLEKFFEAKHDWKAEKIAKAFSLNYYNAENMDQFGVSFTNFMADQKAPAVLEIFTPAVKNGEILKGYFAYLKSKSV